MNEEIKSELTTPTPQSNPNHTFKEKCNYFAKDPKCRRMGKILIAVIAVILFICIVLVPCLKMIRNGVNEISRSTYSYTNEYVADGIAPSQSKNASSELASMDVSNDAASRKEIKNVSVEAKTKDIKSTLSQIYQLTDEFGGYKNSSNIYEENASVTVKIPQKDLDRFLERLEDNLVITRQSSNSYDITNEYQDLESRIKALKTEEESLVEILGQSRDVNDIIAIHDRLANIRDDLDNYESQIKRMDSQVEYSEVSISLIQTERVEPHKDSLGTRIKDRILASFDVIKVVCEWVIVTVAGNIIYLAIIAVIVTAFVLVSKKKKNKKKESNK